MHLQSSLSCLVKKSLRKHLKVSLEGTNLAAHSVVSQLSSYILGRFTLRSSKSRVIKTL